MATCTCPPNIESTSQLCVYCEAEYLRFLDELNNPGQAEDDGSQPATLEEVEQSLSEANQALRARVATLEHNLRTHRAAIEAHAARLAKLDRFFNALFSREEEKGQAA